MKGGSGIWPGKLTKKGRGGFDRDLIVFTFFLFLAFVFWYLNSLGKVTESEIKYPVRYVNLPKERVLVDDLPSSLDISIKGPGYSILKLKLSGDRTPVVLDISSINYRRLSGTKSLSYYVKTSSLLPMLTNQFGTECSITSIKPDSLFFTFDKVISKLVPVVPVLSINTERQYFIKGKVSVEPDTLRVTGPAHMLDTMSCIRTEPGKFTGLNRTVKKSVDILTSGKYSVSRKSATVTIPVEQFTEAETSVQVKIINSPNTLNIRIFPDAVKVSGLVAVSDYKRFRELPFEVILDLAKADLNSEKRLPLEVRNTPLFITSLRLTPPDVDFLIEKK